MQKIKTIALALIAINIITFMNTQLILIKAVAALAILLSCYNLYLIKNKGM